MKFWGSNTIISKSLGLLIWKQNLKLIGPRMSPTKCVNSMISDHVGPVLQEGGLVVDHKAEPPDWEQNLKLIGPIMSPPTFSCTWVQFYKRGVVVDHEAEPPDRLTAGSMLLPSHKLQSLSQFLQYFPNQEFAYRADSCWEGALNGYIEQANVFVMQ